MGTRNVSSKETMRTLFVTDIIFYHIRKQFLLFIAVFRSPVKDGHLSKKARARLSLAKKRSIFFGGLAKRPVTSITISDFSDQIRHVRATYEYIQTCEIVSGKP